MKNSPIIEQKINYAGIDFVYSFYEDDASGLGCIYEIVDRDEYELYRFRNLKGWILDIGANNGLVTLILAALNPESRIICMEPSYDLIKIIKLNLANNHLSNVIVYNAALHDSDSLATFYHATSCSGASSTFVKNEVAFRLKEKGAVSEQVKGITFDNLLRENNIDFINLLKIDCEGGEYHLYKSHFLRKNCIGELVGEFHQGIAGLEEMDAAEKLIGFLRPCVVGRINLTVLDRRSEGESVVRHVCLERISFLRSILEIFRNVLKVLRMEP